LDLHKEDETKRSPSKFLAKGSFLSKLLFPCLKIHLYDESVKLLAGTEKRSSAINATARHSSILNAIPPKKR
jgi:hypothetical protein